MAEPAFEEMRCELDMLIVVSIVAIAKQKAKETGKNRGEFECPRCLTGKLKWSIAESNGHAAVFCDRVVGERDGRDLRCVNATE